MAGARDTVLSAGEIDAPAWDAALHAFGAFAGHPHAAVWYPINLAEGVRPAAPPLTTRTLTTQTLTT